MYLPRQTHLYLKQLQNVLLAVPRSPLELQEGTKRVQIAGGSTRDKDEMDGMCGCLERHNSYQDRATQGCRKRERAQIPQTDNNSAQFSAPKAALQIAMAVVLLLAMNV